LLFIPKMQKVLPHWSTPWNPKKQQMVPRSSHQLLSTFKI
jgi:hypothetical protein